MYIINIHKVKICRIIWLKAHQLIAAHENATAATRKSVVNYAQCLG